MTKRFVGFGELLVRLAPGGYLRFPQAESFTVNYTGAEGNMAIALSYMGVPASLVTKLPENEIGRCAMRKLSTYGVDTTHIVWGGDRIGLYYLERGASQRPSKIIYDRKNSAIALASPEEFDWEDIFSDDVGWFHFTGITAGLSEMAAESCRRACICARAHGIPVSCDLNYRKYLWTPEQAQTVMRPLMAYVDVLIANEEDSEKVLGISAGSDVESGHLSIPAYSDLAERLTGEFGFRKVAITLRESLSASDNNWSGLLYSEGETLVSRKYAIHLVDRVGGGDSFASGLIYGFLNGMSDRESLEYAVAASCLKQTMEFDFNLSAAEEVKQLMQGNSSGRVQR